MKLISSGENRNYKELTYIGSMHTDCRCTGMKPFYSLPEDEVEARKEFEQRKAKMLSHTKSYYSQPWI